MYEEEDDDLPMQYRRLTAHLQTGNADFNRRLSAYLTNHVAMRSALEQSISNSYAQQYPNAPQFAHQAMFPSPMLAHQTQNQQQMMQPPQSPTMYRQAPYPSPRQQQQGFQSTHQRSASIATPADLSASAHSPLVSNDTRRLSMPTVPVNAGSSNQTPTSDSAGTPKPKPSFPHGSFSQQFNQFPSYDMSPFNNNDFSNFSTALPAESQGLLGSTMNMNDPLSQMMMQGSNALPGNFYDFGNQPNGPPQTTSIGKQQSYPTIDGLGSTLAPPPSSQEAIRSQEYNNTDDFFNDALGDNSSGVTPSANEWDSYLNHDAWEIPSSTQTSQ